MNSRTQKLALRAMLIAVAFVLSWLESMIPTFIAVPGVKLGLTNLVVLLALYCLSWQDALAINLIRIILVGLTFGNLFSLWYSMAGGMLSCLGMILLKKCLHARLVTISIAGGLLHNLGQLLVAVFVLDTPSLFYYLVVLWIAGAIAGTIIGLICVPVVSRIHIQQDN
ncbi:MAG: Gx transporter family protein [Eubacterium sp.]|nr:Gx transporter family protein [Eubacterium sp.]